MDRRRSSARPLAAELLDVAPEHVQLAARRRVEATDEVEQSRLAAAARTDEREEFASVHGQVHATEGLHLHRRLEDLRDVARDHQACVVAVVAH